ncbi:MAG: acyl--CoA ligase [Gammaproteobacteria bacterium]|nr:acyl--CoA ligase [Gammaproteobacteria bacterium]
MKTAGSVYRLVDRNIVNGHADKEAIVEIADGVRRSVSYKELFYLTCYYADMLKSHDELKLAIIGESTIETIALWLGAMRDGHCVLLVAADQTSRHYEDIWKTYKPDYVFVDNDELSELGRVIPKINIDEQVPAEYDCVLNTDGDDDILDNRPALCLRTSGSTGKAKICVHAHKNISIFDELILKKYWRFEHTDRILSTAGPFFSFGLQGIYTAFLSGATAVTLPRRKSINQYLEIIGEEDISIIFGVPTLFNILLERHDRTHDMSSLRLTMSAGERLPEIVRFRWESLSGSVVLDSIGTTETFIPYLTEDADEHNTLKQIDGVKYRWIRVASQEFDDLYTVIVDCPSMMIAYYDSNHYTKYQEGAGILETNDLFQLKDDNIVFKSRLSEQIKVSGQWVSPQDLEEFIIKDIRVQKVCVIPVETDDGLTRLSAFVVLKRQSHQGNADHVVDDIMQKTLALRPKALKPESIYIVQNIPQTASGKLLRKSLAEEYIQRKITPLNGAYLY